MINCPKCGADNMIGAIFCRTCGERLNLDELSPDVFDEPTESAGKRITRILQRVIVLVLVLGGGALLAGLFWPVKITVTGELDQNAAGRAGRKYQAVQRPSPSLPAVVPFSSGEATLVVNKALALPKTKGMKKPMMLSVQFVDGGRCKLTLRTLIVNQIPMTTTVMTKPTVEQPGNVKLQILSVTTGKVPLPGGLRNVGLKQFKALDAGTVLAGAEANVKGLDISADSCGVRVR